MRTSCNRLDRPQRDGARQRSARRRCAALDATLDHPAMAGRTGTPLPPLWHWLYFLPMHRQSEIGPDGHAKRGGFLPPVPLPRRMWAGSQFEFRSPVRVGDAVARTSTIDDVTTQGRAHRQAGVRQGAARAALQRRGRAGDRRVPRHRLPRSQAARRRRPAAAGRGRRGAPGSARSCPTTCCCSAIRALTFNGHRIHYDRKYVTEVEGYPGPDRAWPADRDAADGPAAPQRARRRGGELPLQGGAADLRSAPVQGQRPAAAKARASSSGRRTTRAG